MAKEILQEFTFPKPELGIIVRDKILAVRGRGSTYTYEWDVSHHYQPTPDAGVYYPSLTSGDSPGYATATLKNMWMA